MGGLFSEPVWMVGEVDQRLITLDMPLLRATNLGLRYWRTLPGVPDVKACQC